MPKYTFLLLILIVSSSFVMDCKQKELSIDLSYITKEKSKDSRTMREAFVLKDGLLKYSYVDNRYATNKKSSEQKLEKPQLKSLSKITNSNALLRDLEIPKQPDFDAPYVVVLVECKIEYGTKKGSINIYCLTNEAAKNKDYMDVEKLKFALLSFIK